jgi:hypothetical protein
LQCQELFGDGAPIRVPDDTSLTKIGVLKPAFSSGGGIGGGRIGSGSLSLTFVDRAGSVLELSSSARVPINGELLDDLIVSGEGHGMVYMAKTCGGAVESLRLLFHVSYQAML